MVRLLCKAYRKGHGGILGVLKADTGGRKIVAIVMAVLFLYLYIVMCAAFFGIFLSSLSQGVWHAVAVFVLSSFLLSFFFLFSLAVDLFSRGQDIEFLLSLPIGKKDVLASRIAVLGSYCLLFFSMLPIPFEAASLIVLDCTVAWHILVLVLYLSTCLFASSLSMLLAVSLPSRARKPIYAVAVVAGALCLMKFGLSPESIGNTIDSLMSGRIGNEAGPMPLAAASLAMAAVSFLFMRISVGRFPADGAENRARCRGNLRYSGRGVVGALVGHELRVVRSDDGMTTEIMAECFIPLILIAIYTVLGMAGDMFRLLEQVADPCLRSILPGFCVAFFGGMTAISSTSFSREGKGGELVRSLPVSLRERLVAKVIFHLLLELPVAFVLLLSLSLVMGADAVSILLSVLLAIAANVTSSVAGLYIDYRRPFLDWENPLDSVKKNLNVFISMLVTLSCIVVGMFPYFLDRGMSPHLTIVFGTVADLAVLAVFARLFSRAMK